MKLKSVQVKNFKCVEDSTEFDVGSVTCLVGKNEAGKTALLQALHKLSPDIEGLDTFDVLLEYPRRRRREYQGRAERQPDDALLTTWELDDADVAHLEGALGPDVLGSRTVALRKGYYEGLKWEIDLDETKAVQHLLETAALDCADRARYAEAASVAGLAQALEERQGRSQDEEALLERLRETFPEGSPVSRAEAELAGLLPKFVYFSKYHTMSGRVSIQDIAAKATPQLSEGQRVFLSLLDLAGTSAQEIMDVSSSEQCIADLEAASAHITDEIFRYWTQNKNLRVDFKIHDGKRDDPPPYNEGTVFETRILNTRHHVTLNFDERSTGFTWFFSFLVWFSQVKRNYSDNLVILLDDPGLGLHAKAQADLLRYVREKLEPDYQVIYTTHSPFMVDPDRLLQARTVEDVVIQRKGRPDELVGTKVGDRVLSSDADTIFPLQAALGYEITQTLFVGKNTLLVEGPSDLLYLRWFSRRLTERGRKGLDASWTIAPSGGIDKIGAFMALFGGNRLNVAVFVDFRTGHKRKVRELKESKLLRKGHVFTADMYTDGDEADVEDLLGRETYVALVEACYSLSDAYKLQPSRAAHGRGRVVEEVEQHFRTLPADAPDFDHYAPAEHLTENTREMLDRLPGLDEAIDRFDSLFSDINGCLPGR